jgi:hypothetical protein
LERTHVGWENAETKTQSGLLSRARLSRLDKTASYDDNLILEDPEVVHFLTHLVGLCFEHRNVADSILMRFSTLVVHVLLTKHIDVVLAGDEEKLRRIIGSFTGTLIAFTFLMLANLNPSSAQSAAK